MTTTTGTVAVHLLAVRPATPDDLSELHAIASRAFHGLRISRAYTDEQMRAATAARVYEVEPELVHAGTYYGRYVPAVRAGGLLFLSGVGPVRLDGGLVTGEVGRDLDTDAARAAARLTGLQILAVLDAELGSLDRVAQVVKVLGMVNCAPGFNRTPEVVDGCSELLIDVLGDAGAGARSAIGVAELPFDIAVEIEAVVAVL